MLQGRASQSAASGGVTPPPPPYTGPGARDRLPPMKTPEHSLSKFDKLYEKRKPAIEKVQPWFSGYRIAIDDDGNCYGTSWLVLTVVWAVQCRSRLVFITKRLEAARCCDGAFGGLDARAQGYVNCLITYVKEKQGRWSGRARHRDTEDTRFGASLAVEVVKMLRGGDCPKDAREGNLSGEPEWLRLKWGIAIASRALDVCSAGANNSHGDKMKLSTLCESVELDMGMSAAIRASLPIGSEGGNPASSDILRPAGSVGLLASLVVDSYASAKPNKRMSEDYFSFFETIPDAAHEERVDGLAVLKTAIPHFDVFVTRAAGPPLVEALAVAFKLPGVDTLAEDDKAATEVLRLQVESQGGMTQEEVKAVAAAGDAADAANARRRATKEGRARDGMANGGSGMKGRGKGRQTEIPRRKAASQGAMAPEEAAAVPAAADAVDARGATTEGQAQNGMANGGSGTKGRGKGNKNRTGKRGKRSHW